MMFGAGKIIRAWPLFFNFTLTPIIPIIPLTPIIPNYSIIYQLFKQKIFVFLYLNFSQLMTHIIMYNVKKKGTDPFLLG
jgi:hypothetical protein